MSYMVEQFAGWRGQVEDRVEAAVRGIARSATIYSLHNLSMLMSDAEFLRRSLLELPDSITTPVPLDSTTCLNTYVAGLGVRMKPVRGGCYSVVMTITSTLLQVQAGQVCLPDVHYCARNGPCQEHLPHKIHHIQHLHSN